MNSLNETRSNLNLERGVFAMGTSPHLAISESPVLNAVTPESLSQLLSTMQLKPHARCWHCSSGSPLSSEARAISGMLSEAPDIYSIEISRESHNFVVAALSEAYIQ